MSVQQDADEVTELTPEEAQAQFDKITRRHLDMSAEEFLDRWDRGEFPADIDSVPGLTRAVMALPLVR